jgi:pilus assembly protein CpaE
MFVLMKALIIGEKQYTRGMIKQALEDFPMVSVEGEAVTLDTGLRLIEQLRTSVVFLDLSDDVERYFSFVEKVNELFPQTAVIVTSEKDSREVIIHALRSGASDFLTFPMRHDELERALAKVGRVLEASAGTHTGLGKVVSIFNSKGGSGATTIATNVAANLMRYSDKTACVMDLDLQMGDVAVFLDLKPKFTLVDVTNNIQRLDTKFLEDSLARHPSGIAVLAHPEEVEEANAIKPAKIRLVLRLLRGMFDYVLIDTSHTFDELTIEAFDGSDMILLVTTVNLPSIRNARRCLNMFKRLGYGTDKVKLVFNRDDKNNEISLKEAEKVLNYPVFWKLPNDYPTTIASVNAGELIHAVAPRSALHQSMLGLAAEISGLDLQPKGAKGLLGKFLARG